MLLLALIGWHYITLPMRRYAMLKRRALRLRCRRRLRRYDRRHWPVTLSMACSWRCYAIIACLISYVYACYHTYATDRLWREKAGCLRAKSAAAIAIEEGDARWRRAFQDGVVLPPGRAMAGFDTRVGVAKIVAMTRAIRHVMVCFTLSLCYAADTSPPASY